jgi:glucose/mannose transport system permease protein
VSAVTAPVQPAGAVGPSRVRRPRRRRRWRPSAAARTAVLVVMAAVTLVPLYVIVMAALKPVAQAEAAYMWELPSRLDLSGPREALDRLGPNFWNSVIMVVPATLLSSAIGSMAGYLFAKVRFRFDNHVFAALLLGMFIPYQVILVPLIRFLQAIDLYGTIPGLVLVHTIYGIPITTLIFRNYFAGIPDEIREAGQVDGASEFSIFWRLVLPLSLPGFVVAWIFQFTNIWNDFLFGITVVPDPGAQPVTVALNNLSGNFSVQWNSVMSGALLTAAPTVLLYILLGRFYVRGLTSGSVK